MLACFLLIEQGHNLEGRLFFTLSFLFSLQNSISSFLLLLLIFLSRIGGWVGACMRIRVSLYTYIHNWLRFLCDRTNDQRLSVYASSVCVVVNFYRRLFVRMLVKKESKVEWG